MKEIIWNWAIEQARKVIQALWWVIQKAGEILTTLITEVENWIETTFH